MIMALFQKMSIKEEKQQTSILIGNNRKKLWNPEDGNKETRNDKKKETQTLQK